MDCIASVRSYEYAGIVSLWKLGDGRQERRNRENDNHGDIERIGKLFRIFLIVFFICHGEYVGNFERIQQ